MKLKILTKKFTIVLVSMVIYLIVGFYVNCAWTTLEINHRAHIVHIQGVAYSRMESIGQAPKKIDDIIYFHDAPGFQKNAYKYIPYYDPNAWQDATRILFRYQKGVLFWVTFGDGAQGVLTYWLRPSYLQRPKEQRGYALNPGLQQFEDYPRVVILGGIAILIATFVNGRLSRKKKGNEFERKKIDPK